MGILSSLIPAAASTGSAPMDASVTPGMLSSLASPQKIPGYGTFGTGGALGPGSVGRAILGSVGDSMLQLAGQKAVYGPAMLNKQDDDLKRLLLQTQIAKAQQPSRQVMNLGNGGVGQWDSDSGLSILREPEVQEHQTPLEQNLTFLRTLRPDMTDQQAADIAERGISGFQYSQPFVQQKQANTLAQINTRGAVARSTKQLPTYGQMHPATIGGPIAPRSGASALSNADLLKALGG